MARFGVTSLHPCFNVDNRWNWCLRKNLIELMQFVHSLPDFAHSSKVRFCQWERKLLQWHVTLLFQTNVRYFSLYQRDYMYWRKTQEYSSFANWMPPNFSSNIFTFFINTCLFNRYFSIDCDHKPYLTSLFYFVKHPIKWYKSFAIWLAFFFFAR